MSSRGRTRRLVGVGCRVVVVGMLLSVVTVLTGSTAEVGLALVTGSLLVTRVGSRRR